LVATTLAMGVFGAGMDVERVFLVGKGTAGFAAGLLPALPPTF